MQALKRFELPLDAVDRIASRLRPSALIPVKRFGKPAKFGAACTFLCSAQTGYITGRNLLIDGANFPDAF